MYIWVSFIQMYPIFNRKLITHECAHINVLSIKASSGLNVETESGMKWCGDGQNEPIKILHLGNRILALAIMKNKTKNSAIL